MSERFTAQLPGSLRVHDVAVENKVMNMPKSHKPEVTVLMPVFNGARYLRVAIESILQQTFTDFEFLVIDDGSTDNSPEIVSSYNDARIRLVRRGKNIGLIATLNEGLELARGDLVARMDADDISYPDRLEKQLAVMRENPRLVLLGSDVDIIDENGTLISYEPKPVGDKGLKLILSVICAIAHPTVIFRKEPVLKVGGYAEAFHYAEDYDLWTRLTQEGEFCNLPFSLLKYRINPEGESLRNTARQEANARIISDREWVKYGAVGPAPRERWSEIWPDKRSLEGGRRNEMRFYADLHKHFARAYSERGEMKNALMHHLGAVYWQCNLRGNLTAICNTVSRRVNKSSKRERNYNDQ